MKISLASVEKGEKMILIKGIDLPNSGQIELVIRPHGKVLTKTRGVYAEAMQIDLVMCKDCKHSKNCVYPAKWNWCPDGERRTDYTVFAVNPPKGVETPLKGDATVFHKNSKITQMRGE